MGVDQTFLTIRNIIRRDRVVHLDKKRTAQETSLLVDGRLLELTDNVSPAELEQGYYGQREESVMMKATK